jgi:hypothetical protein
MEVHNPIVFAKLLKVPCGALRVHRLRASFLCENPLTNTGLRLRRPQLAQEVERFRANIYHANLAIFRGGCVYALCRGVLEIAPDCDGSCIEINIIPPQAA